MDYVDKIEALLKEHGATLVRTKRHKVYRFPDRNIWVLPSSPRSDQSYRVNYYDLCDFLGCRPTQKKNPARQVKKGVRRAAPSLASGVQVSDFKQALKSVSKYFYRPSPCPFGAHWLEHFPTTPLFTALKRTLNV